MPEEEENEIKKEKDSDKQIKVEKIEHKKSRELNLRRERPYLFFQPDHLFDNLISDLSKSFWYPFSLKRLNPFYVLEEEPIFRRPLINITEDDKSYKITTELPGLDKGEIDVTLYDGTLEIKGETKEENEEKEGEYVKREYKSSSYQRSIYLPENISEDEIETNFEKGVLTIRIPKGVLELRKRKKIKIE